ncbi:hypothetical protein ACVIHF_000531 [Bradyrhizobium sp. USDA 4506]
MSDALPDDPETLKAMLLAERCESERLRQIIKELQRHRFGRRAEMLPEDRMLLGLTRACCFLPESGFPAGPISDSNSMLEDRGQHG